MSVPPESARSVIDVVRERNITFLAASFAYYAFVSIFPLLLLVLAVGTLVGGQQVSTMLIDAAKQFFSSEGAKIVDQTLRNTSGSAGASIVSIVILLRSALKLFRGLVIAFEEVYQRFPDAGIVEQVKKGLATLVAVVLGVALMIAVGAVIGSSLLAGIPYISAIASVVLLLGLAFVFLPLYYASPGEDVRPRGPTGNRLRYPRLVGVTGRVPVLPRQFGEVRTHRHSRDDPRLPHVALLRGHHPARRCCRQPRRRKSKGGDHLIFPPTAVTQKNRIDVVSVAMAEDNRDREREMQRERKQEIEEELDRVDEDGDERLDSDLDEPQVEVNEEADRA